MPHAVALTMLPEVATLLIPVMWLTATDVSIVTTSSLDEAGRAIRNACPKPFTTVACAVAPEMVPDLVATEVFQYFAVP